MTPAESAIIVPVPEAEPVAGPYRARLDRAAGWGVPAHVTVLYPFLPPDALTEQAIRAAATAVASVAAFECVFREVRWFGEEVAWLAPEPGQPFRDLTAAVWGAFPQCPPYGGAYQDAVPHLTIADRLVGDPGAVCAAADAVAAVVREAPVGAMITRAWLMTGSDALGSWRLHTELPLGG